jgi:hypothetical protein
VDDSIEWSAVRPGDGTERSVGGVSDTEQVGDDVVGRRAEDGACLVLVAD